MTANEVNENLFICNRDLPTTTTGQINIAGSNAAPDGTSGGFDGLTALSTLVQKVGLLLLPFKSVNYFMPQLIATNLYSTSNLYSNIILEVLVSGKKHYIQYPDNVRIIYYRGIISKLFTNYLVLLGLLENIDLYNNQ